MVSQNFVAAVTEPVAAFPAGSVIVASGVYVAVTEPETVPTAPDGLPSVTLSVDVATVQST